jgi:addiction module HigA family antidote
LSGAYRRIAVNRLGNATIHPGQVLKEELVARNLPAATLQLGLRVPPQRIQEIGPGKRGLSTENALRLGLHFGNEREAWMPSSLPLRLSR